MMRRSVQQAAAFPIRRTNGKLEVCLIRRKDSGEWGIPKGNIDPGNTPEETALIEAREEAGLRGRLLDQIGTFNIRKWGKTLTVVLYVMTVREQDAHWEEAPVRQRRWMSFEDAAALLAAHPVSRLWDKILRVVAS